MPEKYLTKSKFRLAMDCPAKLYYSNSKDYSNLKTEDSFLQNLANGGFQVGSLAKCYFPGGVEIFTQNHGEALAQTEKLLKEENIIVFEAAFLYENYYVRPDILVKKGNLLEVIEVKAKSCDFADESGFINKKDGTIKKSDWLPKIEDIAFQKYVVGKARPDLEISAFLMLADKTKLCPSDGLNQKFRLVTEEGRKKIKISGEVTELDLSVSLLTRINVDNTCDRVYDGSGAKYDDGYSFEGRIAVFAKSYLEDKKLEGKISSKCKDCEFQVLDTGSEHGLQDGFRECWSQKLNWGHADFEEPTVLDIWKFLSKDKMIAAGKIKISSVEETDIDPKTDGKPGMSDRQRRWMQVQKYQNNDASTFLDKDGLRAEIENWQFPLNFIDFETSTPVIPFTSGRRPYEGIAFQYSHHILNADGQVEHASHFIDVQPGSFPNYEFVRALKDSLEVNAGSIFRYHQHENSILNLVYRQLRADPATIEDREDLCQFIQLITTSAKESEEKWAGKRNMIDLFDLVKRYNYDPATNGSISIKHVLPAILNSSEFLQKKYSKPVYGTPGGIPSLNFADKTWVVPKDGKVQDPYKLLDKVFADESDHDYESIMTEIEAINNGGAAMIAYAKLQFQEMSVDERKRIENALLQYCELDTLAMVMICEAWFAWLKA